MGMTQKAETENNARGGKMKNAIARENFNLNQIENSFESEQSKPAVVCCKSGNRYGVLDG